jgi:hypothetical protein
MSTSPTSFQLFAEAYLKMAEEAKYRPAAPGDGCGGISLSDKETNDESILREEAETYAKRFIEEEKSRTFWIGVSAYRTKRAFMWTIEAARELCGGYDNNQVVIALLRMALADVERVEAGIARKRQFGRRSPGLGGQFCTR